MFESILRAVLLALLVALTGVLFLDAMMEPLTPAPARVVRIQV